MGLNRIFQGIDISATALKAHRKAMEIISENIGNVNTTRTKNGTPYQKKTPVYREINGKHFADVLNNSSLKLVQSRNGNFIEGNGGLLQPVGASSGVEVQSVTPAKQEYRLVYEPSHPDADSNGYVRFPKINILEEMVELMQVSRSFEASVTAMQAAKGMAKKALEI